jgi:serine/threonine protein phosphatase PrpC
MRFSHLESADCTDTGRKRKHNEDSLVRLPEQGLFCVADGMGGTFGGEVASQAAVEGLQHEFANFDGEGRARSLDERTGAVRKALNDSSSWIRNHADEMGVTGTGTTAVVLVFDPNHPRRAVALHAGDSRAYRYRQGKLQQITMDHSVAAAAGVKSDKALPAMFRGVLTRAVGLEKQVMLEETPVDVEPGDLFMLCSDGLTKMVPDKNLARMIKDQGVDNLPALAKLMVDAANAAGGEDNTSVVLVRVADPLPADAPTAGTGTTPTAKETSAGTLTEATRPAPPTSPVLPKAPERRSDPEHFSGVTPAGVQDTPTPATSDFQKTPTAHGGTDRDSERATALRQIEAGRRQNVLVLVCVGLVVLVLAVVTFVLLGGRRKADVPPSSSAPVPVEATSPGTPVPVAEEAAPGAAVPVVEPEPEPEPEVPAPPVAPAGASAAEIERAQASLRVDILETLMTGAWGDLEPRVESARELVPGAVEAMPEAAMYEAWLGLWKRAEMESPPANEMYGELRDAALAVLGLGGMDVALPPAPEWRGSPRDQASAYCAAHHRLQAAVLEALDTHALAAQQQAEQVRKQALPVVEWLQVRAAEPDDQPRVAAIQIHEAAQALSTWILARSSAHVPVTAADLRVDAGARVEAVEAARDALYASLVETVRSVNAQKAGWDAIADPPLKEKVYLLGMQRVRIVNIRARYKEDVRDWRRHEGAEDLRKYLELVREAFPDSAPGS